MNHLKFTLKLILALFLSSCANRGIGPTGGPKDTIPPIVVKTIPENGALNSRKKNIQIDLDENVTIEKPSDNIFVSPPQQKAPDVKSLGKKIVVDFEEELKDSTTYSINFGNSITDMNEKNVLKNYQFAFSTSTTIDSLKISGTVLNAEDLNPLSGIIVGLYQEGNDSVFDKKPFLRIGRTNEKGRFEITNIKKNSYKIFALGDASKDYIHQPGEGIAMCDSLVNPNSVTSVKRDSVWKQVTVGDSTTKVLDSVRVYNGTDYYPSNLVLRYFKEKKNRLYFVKSERKEPYAIKLIFSSPTTSLPEIKPLNFNWEKKYLLQKNKTLDSLTYWITDSTVWKSDTLKMSMKYMMTDSVFHLVPQVDTLNIVCRKLKVLPVSKSSQIKKKNYFEYKANATSPFEINQSVVINFEAPVDTYYLNNVRLLLRKDSIYKEIKYKWKQLDSIGMSFAIENKWLPESIYKLELDSSAFRSVYGKETKKMKFEFKVRSLDDYSKLKINIRPFNPKAILQVMNEKDLVVASKPAVSKGTLFEYLKPGNYYIRLFIDENENGKWDTGELKNRIQPEQVMYLNKKISLLANWEFEETWDTSQVPLLEQKPKELIKDPSKKKE